MKNNTFSPKQVSETLKVSEQTVRLWMRNGKLLGKKVGGEWIIEKQALERFIDGRNFRENISNIDLIKICKFEIDILGTNALGPLHQGRTFLRKKLMENVKIRILILNPDGDAFIKKAHDEETAFGGTSSGRLRKEFEASLAICLDLDDFVRYQRKHNPDCNVGSITVRLYNKMPRKSLLMVDPKTPDGMCNVNIYPDDISEPGNTGTQKTLTNQSLDMDEFSTLEREYNTLWDNAIELRSPFIISTDDETPIRSNKNVFLINLRLQLKNPELLEETDDERKLTLTKENLNYLEREFPLDYEIITQYEKLNTIVIKG
jgi:excisionase family DNA binding protein